MRICITELPFRHFYDSIWILIFVFLNAIKTLPPKTLWIYAKDTSIYLSIYRLSIKCKAFSKGRTHCSINGLRNELAYRENKWINLSIYLSIYHNQFWFYKIIYIYMKASVSIQKLGGWSQELINIISIHLESMMIWIALD